MENKEQSDWRKISDIVNNTLFDPLRVGCKMAKGHRYLQQQLFKMCVHFLACLSKHYKEGIYDGRNEMACKYANAMMEAYLKASNNASEENLKNGYDTFFKEYYKEIEKEWDW